MATFACTYALQVPPSSSTPSQAASCRAYVLFPSSTAALVQWDYDLSQWHPLGYGAHLVYVESAALDLVSARGSSGFSFGM